MILPLSYTSGGVVLGHFKVAQVSGAIAATLAAASPLASFRWTDSSRLAVVTRVRLGYIVASTVTTGVPMDFSLTFARSFTVDFSSNNTQANLATKLKTGALRTSMGSGSGSLLGTLGPQVCTTAAMTGQTQTLDNDFLSVLATPNVATTAGTGAGMQDLYSWNLQGGHPIALAANEGLLVRNITAGPASGTFKIYVEWEWAEVFPSALPVL